MATFEKRLLSSSGDGIPIRVIATTSPGTAVHTAVSGTTGLDAIYLWANNASGSAVTLTVEMGNGGAGYQNVAYQVSIPANNIPVAILVGQVLNNGQLLKAYASVADVIRLTGFVHRIS